MDTPLHGMDDENNGNKVEITIKRKNPENIAGSEKAKPLSDVDRGAGSDVARRDALIESKRKAIKRGKTLASSKEEITMLRRSARSIKDELVLKSMRKKNCRKEK